MTDHTDISAETRSGGPSALGPVSESSRIEVMDILRGFALIGIIFMNVEWFSRSIAEMGRFDPTLTGVDHAAGWLVRCFVEGKFYKLFTLLFGMGFTVMLLRAQEAGRPFGAWFSRRMAALLVIGLSHAIFIWNGDILTSYAIGGFAFLLWIYAFRTQRLRRFNKPKTFLKIGLVWIAMPVVVASVVGLVYGVGTDSAGFDERWQTDIEVAQVVAERLEEPVPEETEADEDELQADSDEAAELTDEERKRERIESKLEAKRERVQQAEEQESALAEGSYLDGTAYRLSLVPRLLGHSLAFVVVMMIPICLVGYWLVVSGVLRNHRQHRSLFSNMAWIGTASGLALSVGGLLILQHPATEISRSLGPVGGTLFYLSQYLMSAGYVGIIVLLADARITRSALRQLAPFGRMALTNYIMQSVIMAAIFYGFAGGLYRDVGRGQQMLLAMGIILVQILYSKWWMARFRFGPLEWVWRCATYKSLQPIRLPP